MLSKDLVQRSLYSFLRLLYVLEGRSKGFTSLLGAGASRAYSAFPVKMQMVSQFTAEQDNHLRFRNVFEPTRVCRRLATSDKNNKEPQITKAEQTEISVLAFPTFLLDMWVNRLVLNPGNSPN